MSSSFLRGELFLAGGAWVEIADAARAAFIRFNHNHFTINNGKAEKLQNILDLPFISFQTTVCE